MWSSPSFLQNDWPRYIFFRQTLWLNVSIEPNYWGHITGIATENPPWKADVSVDDSSVFLPSSRQTSGKQFPIPVGMI